MAKTIDDERMHMSSAKTFDTLLTSNLKMFTTNLELVKTVKLGIRVAMLGIVVGSMMMGYSTFLLYVSNQQITRMLNIVNNKSFNAGIERTEK